MRIIAGDFRGRRFDPPAKGWDTRPTTDRAKESLFNILRHSIALENLVVADLFAGTGNIGYEFLSHRAARVDFVEKYRPCTQFIKKISSEIGCQDRVRIFTMEVTAFLENAPAEPYDLIFADPPYAWPQLPHLPQLILRRHNWLKPDGQLIIEHDIRTNFENDANFAAQRTYGEAIFSFFNP